MSNEKLSVYRAKRDFGKTAEPSGDDRVAPAERLRFVIQKHAATRLHYDLRIELDGVFKSWAVTKGPSIDPHDKRLAVEVEDHPLAYGDFEGTIPAGEYGGGTVMVWDRGYWEPEGPLDPGAALAKGDFKFRLDGQKLQGSWVLVRMKRNRPGDKRTNWLLIKHRDAFAVDGQGDAVLAQDRSVASGRTLDAIAAGEGAAPKSFVDQAAPPGPADAVWGQDEPAKAKPAAVRAKSRASSAEKSAPKRSRAKPAGDDSAAPNGAVSKVRAPKTAASKSPASKPSGSKPSGSKTSGSKASGSNGPGSKAVVPKAAGAKPTRAKPAAAATASAGRKRAAGDAKVGHR